MTQVTQNSHTQSIREWHGSDSKPLPTPCELSSCRFCSTWYGIEIGPPRVAAWRRLNLARGTPKASKASIFERLVG